MGKYSCLLTWKYYYFLMILKGGINNFTQSTLKF